MKSAKSIKNGYKPETIAKIIMILKALIKMYAAMIKKGMLLTVSISDGNIKIGKVLNVSLAPIITCGAMCKYCKGLCYDIKACLQYKDVRIARAKNTALALYNRKEYFRQIEKKLERRKSNLFLRWHVSGDILDYDYLDRMIQLAKKFPAFRFWTYTKQYHIVNEWIHINGDLPSNLKIMLSQWKVKTEDGKIVALPLPNPYNLPIFTVRFAEEEIPKNLFKCPGNCDICKRLNRGCIAGESTYNDAH